MCATLFIDNSLKELIKQIFKFIDIQLKGYIWCQSFTKKITASFAIPSLLNYHTYSPLRDIKDPDIIYKELILCYHNWLSKLRYDDAAFSTFAQSSNISNYHRNFKYIYLASWSSHQLYIISFSTNKTIVAISRFKPFSSGSKKHSIKLILKKICKPFVP